MVIEAKRLASRLKPHGRTFLDGDTGALFFNWTCSGFTVTFRGKKLRVKLLTLPDTQPFPPDSAPDYPCVGLVGEDGETLVWRTKCTEGESWYDVWEGGDDGPHTVRLVKLSENARGKTGLLAMETDGELLDCAAPEKSLSIEFVGDSITCGFGNEAPGQDSLFETAEENGWRTFGAVAGRELNAEFNMISVSGISAVAPKTPMFPAKPMNELYEYLDALYDERQGRPLRPWDFAGHKKDVVVVNLGTNDVNAVRFYTELTAADGEEAHFRVQYRGFIEKIRALNGPDALICCTLGPLDYYLYDHIRDVVEAYSAETGDRRVRCFKLIGVNLMTEGWGAVSHPSAKTQQRMGRELAARLRTILADLPERI